MKMKKILTAVTSVFFAMFLFAGCGATETTTEATTTSSSSVLPTVGMMAMVIVVFYFFLIRPEKKRKKQAQDMRDNVEIGDKIVTIGGIVGKVVRVTDDKIIFETGEDRVRMEVNKWAVSSNEGKGANKEKSDSEETLDK